MKWRQAAFEIVAQSLIQGIGSQTRTSRYHVLENGSCAGITATQLDTYENGGGTAATLGTSLSACTVTFSYTFPSGTTANSIQSYSARVVGTNFDAAME
jgi:hypothetical protein